MKIYRCCYSRSITPKPVLDYYSIKYNKKTFPQGYLETDKLAEFNPYLTEYETQISDPHSHKHLGVHSESRATYFGLLGTCPGHRVSICSTRNPPAQGPATTDSPRLTWYEVKLSRSSYHKWCGSRRNRNWRRSHRRRSHSPSECSCCRWGTDLIC